MSGPSTVAPEHSSVARSPETFAPAASPPAGSGSPDRARRDALAALAPRLDACEHAELESALARAVDGRRPLGPVVLAGIRGGGRLRPLLVREAFLAVGDVGLGGADDDAWLPAAVAVELVHAASLAHDDLPAFDDADERRGEPSLHVRAGVPAAVLAGDAMLASGLATAARGLPPATAGIAVDLLARAAVAMCRGQHEDLTARDERSRRRANARKSGTLFAAAGALGVLARGGDALAGPMPWRLAALGMRLGLAYQAVDDVRDGDGVGRAAAAAQLAALRRRLASLPRMPRVAGAVDRLERAAAAVPPAAGAAGVTPAP